MVLRDDFTEQKDKIKNLRSVDWHSLAGFDVDRNPTEFHTFELLGAEKSFEMVVQEVNDRGGYFIIAGKFLDDRILYRVKISLIKGEDSASVVFTPMHLGDVVVYDIPYITYITEKSS